MVAAFESGDGIESVRILRPGAVVTSPRTERNRTSSRRSGPSAGRSPLAKPNPQLAEDAPPDDEPEASATTAPDADGDDRNVDGLFARIRADRAGAVAKAREVLAEPADAPAATPAAATTPTTPTTPTPVEPTTGGQGATPARAGPTSKRAKRGAGRAATARSASTATAAATTTRANRATEPAPTAASNPPPTGQPTAATPTGARPDATISDADEVILQRRDKATTEIEVALARRLKRAMQDEQNDLLDRLRGVRGAPKATSVLPPLAAQRERIATAGRPLLEQAARAGGVFGRELVGLEPDPTVPLPDVEGLAAALADAIAAPLRRRLEQAFTDTAGDDQAVLVEALGASYREWKTQRIELLAGDHVTGAFSLGAFEAFPQGTRLRWLVEDVDGRVPRLRRRRVGGESGQG